MTYFLLSLFDWKFEGADIVMEWVALITALGALVTLIVSVVQTAKEKVLCAGITQTSKKN